MRVNVYSQELILDLSNEGAPELGIQQSNTGIGYSFVRLPLHSSPKLHHPPHDDDRSAITFWLPRSTEKQEALATIFEEMARMVRQAPAETGLD